MNQRISHLPLRSDEDKRIHEMNCYVKKWFSYSMMQIKQDLSTLLGSAL